MIDELRGLQLNDIYLQGMGFLDRLIKLIMKEIPDINEVFVSRSYLLPRTTRTLILGTPYKMGGKGELEFIYDENGNIWRSYTGGSEEVIDTAKDIGEAVEKIKELIPLYLAYGRLTED